VSQRKRLSGLIGHSLRIKRSFQLGSETKLWFPQIRDMRTEQLNSVEAALKLTSADLERTPSSFARS